MEEKPAWREASALSRIYILVEGQTEEAFVNELLVPHYAKSGRYLTPIIIRTSAAQKGGLVSYGKVRPQIQKLCKQDEQAYVTTMFDLYALPKDFPGKGGDGYSHHRSGRDKANDLQAALGTDIGMENFIPNLIVHEFEALLFTDIDVFGQWTNDDSVLGPLLAIRDTTSPEDINDGPTTAPSKRILSAMSGYSKTLHGPLIACDIGLDAIRGACPHFDDWLKKLEGL